MFLFREQTIYRRAKLIPHNEEDIVDNYKLKEDKIMNNFKVNTKIGEYLLSAALVVIMIYGILVGLQYIAALI